MRKAILATIIVFIAVISALTESSAAIPVLNLSLMNQDPDPARPGSYVDIRFKIQNNGATTADELLVELIPEYPFTLDSTEEASKYIGVLPPTGTRETVTIVKYKIRVDENAIEGTDGTNKIALRYKIGTGSWIKQEFNIDVRTTDATIAIESVKSIPERIKPGEAAKVEIKVKNIADSTIKDISLKFDLGLSTLNIPATSTSLAYYDLVPFAPLHSATEKKVKMISSGEEVTFVFDIVAYANAEPRVYKIPIQLRYFDQLGEEYIKNDIVGLTVGTKPDIAVTIDKTEIYLGKSTGEVIVEFINKGFTDVKFLYVTLLDSEDYEVLSSEKVYIGNLDSDDYETADFTLYVNGGKDMLNQEREITLPLSVEYKDANNEAYSDQYDLKLMVRNPKKLGVGNGNSTALFVVIIAVIVVGFFIYRRIRKKRK